MPNEAFAQQSHMPLEDIMDFYFNATLVDWKKEGAALQKVKNLMANGQQRPGNRQGDRYHIYHIRPDLRGC